VFCEISRMVAEMKWLNWKTSYFFPFLDVLVKAFGPQRLMFGSDWRFASRQRITTKWLESWKVILKISQVNRQDVFGAIAVKFYNLKVENV